MIRERPFNWLMHTAQVQDQNSKGFSNIDPLLTISFKIVSEWWVSFKIVLKWWVPQEYLNINYILKMLLLSTDMTIFTLKFTIYLEVNLWLNIITCMWDHLWYLWKNKFGWTNYKVTPKHIVDLSVKMVVSRVFLNRILKATKLP